MEREKRKMIFQLTNEMIFPHPSLAEEDGWLAVGGDLSQQRLLLAYSNGIFPWYSEGEPICWYSPPIRCVLFPQKIKESKSMKKVLESGVFRISFNTAFAEVIGQCKQLQRPGQDGTWITDEMEAAYISLHQSGIAKSVEVWKEDELVGGLYGVALGNIFCGESMFSIFPNSSKAALIWLCKNGSYQLIDCQIITSHLLSMGAEAMERDKYLELLSKYTR